MNIAAEFKNVRKVYDKIPVVKDLSFHIKAGEIFGLLGSSRAVKSIPIECKLLYRNLVRE